MAPNTSPPDTTNFRKFQTGNPVVRRLIERFYRNLREIVEPLKPESFLDAGCGEGETLERLKPLLPRRVAAFDLNPESVQFTRERHPEADVRRLNIFTLPFEPNSFDSVVCLEVLEHLDNPKAALRELLRVSRRDVIVSVPHEPWFRLGSMLRLKYLKSFGNHPEHIQQFNPTSLRAMVTEQADVVEVRTSFPWVMLHCRKRAAR